MSDIVPRLTQPFGYFSRALRCAAAEEIVNLRSEIENLNMKLDVLAEVNEAQASVINELTAARKSAMGILGVFDEKPVQWVEAGPEEDVWVQAS